MTTGLCRLSSQRGAAFVELVITLPLLIVIIVGSVDFGRAFYMAIELQNAARAGAQYGAQSVTKVVDVTGMEATAAAAAVNISPVTPAASYLCQCATADPVVFSATSPPNNCAYTCASGAHIVANVTVTASATFSMIAFYPIPGISHTFSIRRGATMRGK